MARHEEGRLQGRGGLELYWQAWLPDGEARAVVVIAHGVSEHSARYAHVGERFAAGGHATYALDHRGHGRSQGRRAVIDRMDHVVADLREFIGLAGDRHGDAPVFLLGHSMGGAVALAYALEHQEEISGLILSAPLAALQAASPVTRIVARTLSALTPHFGVYAVDATAVSRDPEVVRDYVEDPLVHHGKLPARTVAELSRAVEGFPERVPSLHLPLLALHGTADTLTPLAGSLMVYERAGSDDKARETFDGLYHELLNEPERERVMDLIVAWIDART